MQRERDAGREPVLFNLASDEYFKSVKPAKLKGRLVTAVFEDWKGGRYKIISFYAKRAARPHESLRHPEPHRRRRGLKGFDSEGYALRRKLRMPTRSFSAAARTESMRISSSFDAGAIEIVSLDDPQDIRLRLRADNAADFRQWFHFRLMDAAGKSLRLVIENAAEAAYPDGWPGYRCVASYDRRTWFRVAGTRYEDGRLIVEHTPERDSVYYAYFEPYSHERHRGLAGAGGNLAPRQRAQSRRDVDGRDLDVVVVGHPSPARRPVWIIARQHPGETMAEWFVEGLLERLLDGADAVARKVRSKPCCTSCPT